jgi:hypothetical protein
MTADTFFKPEKIAATNDAKSAVDEAHLIVSEEAAARAAKTKKLREARLGLTEVHTLR